MAVLALGIRTSADEVPSRLTSSEMVSATELAMQAIRIGDWETSVKHLRIVVDSDPDHGRAVFYLGYSLHNLRRWEEAIEMHRLATRFPDYSATARYNWACALARLGLREDAVVKLRESIEFGFRHPQDVGQDMELKAVFDHPDFQELRQRAMPHSRKPTFRHMDFMLGKWEELDETGAIIGRSSVSRINSGPLVSELWSDGNGARANRLSLYDKENKEWRMTWSDSRGLAVSFQGRMTRDGLRLVGRGYRRDGSSRLYRMLLTPRRNGVVNKSIDISRDGGIYWEKVSASIYRRPKTVEDRGETSEKIARRKVLN